MDRVSDAGGGALWARLLEFGGYTVDPYTGEAPAAGLAVSVPNFQRTYAITFIRPADITAGLTDASRAASILGIDRKFYAGAWHDFESGLVYLDTSIVVADRITALEYARLWRQLAIYDLRTEETVHVSELVPIR